MLSILGSTAGLIREYAKGICLTLVQTSAKLSQAHSYTPCTLRIVFTIKFENNFKSRSAVNFCSFGRTVYGSFSDAARFPESLQRLYTKRAWFVSQFLLDDTKCCRKRLARQSRGKWTSLFKHGLEISHRPQLILTHSAPPKDKMEALPSPHAKNSILCCIANICCSDKLHITCCGQFWRIGGWISHDLLPEEEKSVSLVIEVDIAGRHIGFQSCDCTGGISLAHFLSILSLEVSLRLCAALKENKYASIFSNICQKIYIVWTLRLEIWWV